MEVGMTQGREGASEVEGRNFGLRRERVNGSEHVRVAGELDLSVIGLVDREIEHAEATDASRIVLELDELEFMDAAGIRLLLRLNARSDDDGWRLRIRGRGGPQVRRVLNLTGVGELLPFEA
jgi:anti-anti-sigma factor